MDTEGKPITRWATKISLLALFAVFVLITKPSSAQVVGAAVGNSEQGESHGAERNNSPDRANAEILQELERMRTRIQELESRLKQRDIDPKPTSKTDSRQSSTVVSHKVVSDSMSLSQPSEQEPTAFTGGQASREPRAEPFALADWTWLNGNPRTREPALIRSSSRRRFAPTLPTTTISIIPKTTQSAARAKYFVRTKSALPIWASVETSITTMFALVCSRS